MLERKISKRLLEWKSTKRNQGLLVTGARQVGKTFAIERFAREQYASSIKIDFVEQPDAVGIIAGARNLDDLVMRITALASEPLQEGKTLLFFDEVQRCGDSITWMRYLAADPRFDVIYSGSMLGVEAYDFRSLPVGTIDIVEMFPMDFEEFSWACGVLPTLWDVVRQCYAEEREVPDFIHERLIDCFYRYVLVGGMPEAVETYVTTKDTQAMRARQKSILDAYRADITRYVRDPEHSQRIKTIFNAVPAQLNKENRRFAVSGIDKTRRFLQLQPDFDWLENAGVVIPVRRVGDAAFPLGLQCENSQFKLYMSDCGLLFSTFGSQDVEDILLRAETLNLGLVFENAVAQELRAAGRDSLYYYSTRGRGEVDFLIEKRNLPEVVPVEVKSGKGFRRHASLDNLMRVENYHLKEARVLYPGNVMREGSVLYLPLYMTGLL